MTASHSNLKKDPSAELTAINKALSDLVQTLTEVTTSLKENVVNSKSSDSTKKTLAESILTKNAPKFKSLQSDIVNVASRIEAYQKLGFDGDKIAKLKVSLTEVTQHFLLAKNYFDTAKVNLTTNKSTLTQPAAPVGNVATSTPTNTPKIDTKS